jgi:beta-phosphoglucomutase
MTQIMGYLKACIFDLDGVVVDTAKYHFLAWKRIANELGFDFSEQENELLKGVSRMRSLEILLELAGKERSMAKKTTGILNMSQKCKRVKFSLGLKHC